MKIIDKVKEQEDLDQPFLSFEYFPPRTEDGVQKLYEKIGLMKPYGPLFMDFTWGAGGSTADLTLELTIATQQRFGITSNMHLTCTGMPKEKVHEALRKAKEGGIKNIVALRGDPPTGQEEWKATDGGFTSALCLVRFIRQTYGSHFGIGVAGYPEGHPNKISRVESLDELSESERKRCATLRDEGGEVIGYSVCKDNDYEDELTYLFEKVQAGADMIFTQMFFDVDCYTSFVDACRAKGISVPIIPGLMCINTVPGLKRMVGLCKTRVPDALWDQVQATDVGDEEAGRALGISFGRDTCRKLLDFGVPGLHFYSLNQHQVPLAILDAVGLGPNTSVATIRAAAAAASESAQPVADETNERTNQTTTTTTAPLRLNKVPLHFKKPLKASAEEVRA